MKLRGQADNFRHDEGKVLEAVYDEVMKQLDTGPCGDETISFDLIISNAKIEPDVHDKDDPDCLESVPIEVTK